jgi:hypothetical protein
MVTTHIRETHKTITLLENSHTFSTNQHLGISLGICISPPRYFCISRSVILYHPSFDFIPNSFPSSIINFLWFPISSQYPSVTWPNFHGNHGYSGYTLERSLYGESPYSRNNVAPYILGNTPEMRYTSVLYDISLCYGVPLVERLYRPLLSNIIKKLALVGRSFPETC